MVLIIKFVTTSIKYSILEVEEIKSLEDEENTYYITFNNKRNGEKFRSNEGPFIIKTFYEFQKKALEQVDKKQLEAEENKRINDIGANLNDILSFP